MYHNTISQSKCYSHYVKIGVGVSMNLYLNNRAGKPSGSKNSKCCIGPYAAGTLTSSRYVLLSADIGLRKLHLCMT